MAKKGALGIIELGAVPEAVGDVRSWSVASETAEIDTTIMGSGNARIQPGSLRDGLEAELFFEFADAGQALIIAGRGSETPIAVALYPQGKAAGLPVWNASCYVMSASTTATAEGAIEMTAVFTSDENGAAWTAQA